MTFEWNELKSKNNLSKHGVRFEEAQVIWTDENALEFYDPEHSENEDRFIRVGLNVKKGVVFCEKDEGNIIRIISARKATASERKHYEEQL